MDGGWLMYAWSMRWWICWSWMDLSFWGFTLPENPEIIYNIYVYKSLFIKRTKASKLCLTITVSQRKNNLKCQCLTFRVVDKKNAHLTSLSRDLSFNQPTTTNWDLRSSTPGYFLKGTNKEAAMPQPNWWIFTGNFHRIGISIKKFIGKWENVFFFKG